MGGPMQPQGHFQVVRGLVDDGARPAGGARRAAVAGRRRRRVSWSRALAEAAERLAQLGHDAEIARDRHRFGVGQIIVAQDDVLIGGVTAAAMATPPGSSPLHRARSVRGNG